MYLRNLIVQRLKLLHDVKVSFTRADGSARNWTVFVGENRLCKTTLLQAIAVLASGGDRGTQLAADVVASWPDLRQPDTVHIAGDFGFSEARHGVREYPLLPTRAPRPPYLVSELTLMPDRRVFDGLSYYWDAPPPRQLTDPVKLNPLVEARSKPLRDWFVAGYGTNRAIRSGRRPPDPDPSVDRLRPLFGGDVIGTAFADLFDADKAREFAKVLQRVLVEGELLPHVRGLSLVGRGGVSNQKQLVEGARFELEVGAGTMKVPAVWLSQGYQSLIAWLADVVGYILLEADQGVEPEQMEGLVLVDEIDLHLHPTWQVRLIPALKRVFPRIQFVATTHSPMVLPGLEAEEVWFLEQDADGNVTARQSDRSPALLTGSELLSAFFEIQTLYPNELGEKLRRYGYLANDPSRTPDEDAEASGLRTELARHGVHFDSEPVPRETSA